MKNRHLSFDDCCRFVVDNEIKYIAVNDAPDKQEISVQFKDKQCCCHKHDNTLSTLEIYTSFLANNIKSLERINKQTLECICFDGTGSKIQIEQIEKR